MNIKIAENKAWFIGRHDYQPSGPKTVENISDEVRSGKWLPTDWICNPVLGIKWRRYYESTHVPESVNKKINSAPSCSFFEAPSLRVYSDLTDIYQPLDSKKVSSHWYLQFRGSKFGPLSYEECLRIIHSGQLKEVTVYCWRLGMQEWLPVAEVPEMTSLNKIVQKLSNGDSINNRKNDRMNLLSTCTLRFEHGPAAVGVIQDLSRTGVKVITECSPPKGTRTLLEILPVDYPELGLIKVKAEVVRATSNPQGLAFKFLERVEKFDSILRKLKE